MKRKVAVFLTSSLDYERLLSSGIREIHDGVLVPVIFDGKHYLEQAEELIAKGVQAFIVRGGYYYWLRDAMPEFPILQLQVSRGDIMTALLEVRRHYKNIYLLLREQENLPTYNYNALLDMEYTLYLEHHSDGDQDEVIRQMRRFLSEIPRSSDTVVVGGALVVQYAHELGLNSKFICTTPEEIMSIYESAQQLLDQLLDRQNSIEQRDLVMDNVGLGIAILDKNRQITHVNACFEQMTGRFSVNLLQKTPEDLWPEYEKDGRGQTQTQQIDGLSFQLNEIKTHSGSGEIFSILLLRPADGDSQIPVRTSGEASAHKKAFHTFDDFGSREKSVRKLTARVKQYALTDLPIVISGASGTGKSRLAQCIHNYSRRDAPYIELNCATLSDAQLEIALFGRENDLHSGALEAAGNGTVFLREINSLPGFLQARLLHALRDREIYRSAGVDTIPIHARIIASTTVDLQNEVLQGRFRGDLFYRLDVLDVKLPALKERKKDILFLFRIFAASVVGCGPEEIPIDDALSDLLLECDWPGNLTQLQSVAYQYAFSYKNEGFDVSQLNIQSSGFPPVVSDDLSLDLKQINKVVEELVIDSLLRKGMSKTDVAKLLGISRTALYNKMDNIGK